MIPGAHVSAAGGVSQAPLNARKLGVKAMQIFTRNQNRWKSKPISPDEVERFFRTRAECGIQVAVAHDSYLINLCTTDSSNLEKSRAAMLDELHRASLLKLEYLVMHPGSHLGAGEDAGIRAFSESMRMLLDQTADSGVTVLLETTAGQGTNLGYRFEHLAEMMRLMDAGERVAVCLDTCHIFAAGYDYGTPELYQAVMREFDEVIGLDKLKAVHINDSKGAAASRVDRHEHLGQGKIGAVPIGFFLNDPRLGAVPALLETPGDFDDYKRNLAIMLDLMGRTSGRRERAAK